PVMLLPMAVLAVGAVIAGFLGLSMTHTEWWAGSIVINDVLHPGTVEAHNISAFFKYLPLVAGIAGIGLAVLLYLRRTDIPGMVSKAIRPLYKGSLNKWYIDELYDLLFVRPARFLGNFLWKRGDEGTIDR